MYIKYTHSLARFCTDVIQGLNSVNQRKQQKDNKTKERFDCDLEYHRLLHTITCFAHIECNPAGANAIVAHIPVNKQLS